MNLYTLLTAATGRLLLALLLLATGAAHAQAPAWQTALVLSDAASITATAAGPTGDVYVTGVFSNVLHLGTITLSSAGGTDAFVARWSAASGRFAWAVRGGSTGNESAAGIAVQGSAVYITGSFTALATFGSTVLSSIGNDNVYVAKLTDAGTSASFAWAVAGGSAAGDYTAGIAVSGTSVYVAGVFGDNTAVFGPATITKAVTGSNGGDVFVAKLTDAGTTGSFVWAQAGGGNQDDRINDVAATSSGVYVVGTFTSPEVRFGSTQLVQSGNSTAFVAKLTDAGTSGSFAWARQSGGDNVEGQALAVSGSDVYVAGNVNGPATFGSVRLVPTGSYSVFVAKLTDAGSTASYVWAEVAATTDASVSALAVSGSSVYLAGRMGPATSFGSIALTSAGDADLFVTKLTDAGPNASTEWAQRAGGAGPDVAYTLAVSGTTVYVGGIAGPPINFGGAYFDGAYGSQTAFLASLNDLPQLPVLAGISPRSGTIGNAVTLSGTRLAGITAVTFAGAAPVTTGLMVNGDGTQVSGVVVPGGATSGLVTVTTPGGTSAGLPFAVATTAVAPGTWQASTVAVGAAEINATATDASGNVFVTGTFQNTATFGSTTLTSAGSFDVFVAKWSPATQDYVWAQRAGGTDNDQARGLAVGSGGIYLTGWFASGTAAFGSTTLANANPAGGLANDDMYVAKLADAGATGAFVWALRAGGAFGDYAYAVAVSGSSVYIGGDLDSRTAAFGALTLTNPGTPGNVNGFVARLADAGPSASFQWVYPVGGVTTVRAVAGAGASVYVAGAFTFPTTIGTTALTPSGSSTTFDMYVAKLADAGPSAAFQWAAAGGGVGADEATTLAVNGTNVYVGGIFQSTTAFFGNASIGNRSREYHPFVVKLTDAGNSSSFVWAQEAGGTGGEDLASLAVSGSSLYLAGAFGSQPAAFGEVRVSAAGYNDGYLAKLADLGSTSSFLWVKTLGGPSGDRANAVALAGTTVYVAGVVMPPATIDGLTIPGPFTGSGRCFLTSVADAPAPLPTLTSLSPASGGPGTALTLTGTNLAGTTAVAFAGTGPVVLSTGFTVNTAGTQLTGVLVPPGAATGLVTASTPGGTSNGLAFTLAGPPANDDPAGALALSPTFDCAITSGTSAAATASTTGGLGTPAQAHDVFFRFVAIAPAVRVRLTSTAAVLALELYQGTATALAPVVAPAAPTPGGLVLSAGTLSVGQAYYLRVSAETSGAGQPFALCVATLPTVVSLAPTSGPVGTVVTITGTGLGSAGSVRFAGGSTVNAAAFRAASATSLQLAVPPGATTGPLTVVTPANTLTTAQTFTVTAPQLAVAQGSTSYPSGATYSFGNQPLGATSAAVRFTLSNPGTSPLTITSLVSSGDFALAASSSLVIAAGGTGYFDLTFAPVVPGSRTGTLFIGSNAGTYVLNLGGVGIPPVPVLTSIAPLSGMVGATVTFNGYGLNGTTSISFNGVPQTVITSIASTALTTTVPAGAPVGSCPVTVTTPGGTSNAVAFIVTAAPPAWQMASGAIQAVSNTSTVLATAADAAGNVYVGGAFRGTVSWGGTTLTSAGGTDGYVAKWSRATGTFVWAQRVGGLANEEVLAVAVSGSSIYLAGYFGAGTGTGGSLVLGGTTLTTTAPTGGLLVAKLTDAGPSAGIAWAQQANAASSSAALAVGVSGASVYVTGRFSGSALVLGGASLPGSGTGGPDDIFVTKLTDAGPSASFTWAQKAGGAFGDVASSLAVSGASVYIAGRYASTTAAFGATTLTTNGTYNLFVAKLTDAGPTGSFTWARQTDGGDTDDHTCVAVSGANVYLAGTFVTASIGFDALTLTRQSTADMFVAKLTDAGTTASFGWAQRAGGQSAGYGRALAVNGTGVYVAGFVRGYTASFGIYNTINLGNNAGADAFVTRLTDLGTTGRFEWVQMAGGQGEDYAYALALNGATVYVGGFVASGARFSGITLPGPGGSDSFAFLASLNDLIPTPTAAARPADPLRVYPNPAHRTATVVLPAGAAGSEVRLVLLDAVGRLVRTHLAPAGPRAELDVSGLPAGIYMLRITAGGRTATQRLVVE
ncbi:hypothetical protein ACVWYF_002253 [Hymenobacter sp. UYAg731]